MSIDTTETIRLLNEIISKLENKQAEEDLRNKPLPENEIMYTKDRFFIIPRRVRIKSTGKTKWIIGSVKNCRSIKYYFLGHEDYGPEMPMGDLVLKYNFYYEVD